MPFTVFGDLLGAGKTTLLNRWLQVTQGPLSGQRLAVLVNDLGAINLDAAALVQAGDDIIARGNGCVCCTIGDDLTEALGRVLAAQPPFDAVVIEASGVSDPWRIAQYALVGGCRWPPWPTLRRPPPPPPPPPLPPSPSPSPSPPLIGPNCNTPAAAPR